MTTSQVVQLGNDAGGHKNETRTLAPHQASMILGLKPGYFTCVTITSAPDARACAGAKQAS